MTSLIQTTLMLTTAAMIASVNTSFAATLTWDGGGADNNWTTDANWDGTGDDDNLLTFETLNFAGSTRLTANNTTLSGKNVNSILFDASAGAFTLTGEYVDMLGKDTNNTAARGPAYVTNNSANTQTINLSLNNYGGIPYNTGLIFENTAGGTIVVNGVITEAGGGSTIYKNGGGTLELNGNNTFTTNVVVNGGTLKIGNANALGTQNAAATKVTVASGGTVDFNGEGNAGYGYTIAGTGVGGNGALVNNGAAITTGTKQTSNITLSADASIGGTGDWALLAAAWGPTTLDLATNTLTKSGANTFTLANATVTAGSLQIDEGTFTQIGSHNLSAVAVSLANTASANLNLNLHNLSVGSLAGGGAVGGNVVIVGARTLTVGDLDASETYAGVISGSGGGLTKTGSGTQTLTNTSTYTGATVVNEGTLKLNASGLGFNAGALANTSSITVNSGATLDVAKTGNTKDTTAIVLDGGTLHLSAGTGGGGPGANYTNNLTLNSGAQVTGATADDGLRFGYFNNATVTVGGSSASTINTDVMLVNNTGGRSVTFDVADASSSSASDLTISGNIIDFGGGGLTNAPLIKTGVGTMELTGTNTYAGTTTVNAGTLSLASGSSHSGSGAYTVNGSTLEIATGVDLSGHAMTIAGVISPGNSPGTAATGAQTWLDGGSYLWEINNSNGTKGVDEGWDWLDITGTLDLTNLTAGGFTIDITSLTTANDPGLAAGFDYSGLAYGDSYGTTFIIASADTISGFDASLFTLDDSAFVNGKLDWSIIESGTDLVFSAVFVPEPSSTALLGLGGLALPCAYAGLEKAESSHRQPSGTIWTGSMATVLRSSARREAAGINVGVPAAKVESRNSRVAAGKTVGFVHELPQLGTFTSAEFSDIVVSVTRNRSAHK